MDEWYAVEEQAVNELYDAVRSLGGKISGEHGIGLKRKPFMQRLTDPVELKLMRAVKRAFDPHNIMNPGKLFDVEEQA